MCTGNGLITIVKARNKQQRLHKNMLLSDLPAGILLSGVNRERGRDRMQPVRPCFAAIKAARQLSKLALSITGKVVVETYYDTTRQTWWDNNPGAYTICATDCIHERNDTAQTAVPQHCNSVFG